MKAARYPGGRPQFGLAAARADRAARATASAPPAATSPNPSSPSPGKNEIPPCTPVNASQPHPLQQLVGHQPASVQDKYFSIPTLKTII